MVHPETSVHLVGIGGAGMSGIARILLQRGRRVSGSDLRESRALDELRALGADIRIGHDASHVGEATIVVTSSAVPAGNPEVDAARRLGRRVLRRAEMLAELMAPDRAVLVSGTHGKTTTTSMTVVALQAAGLDPTFAIGGSLNESGTNAHAGADELFVAEADESDRSFLVYRPDVAVVTNVEHDHPDEFRDMDAVSEAFRAFLDRRAVGGTAVMCVDDPGARRLAADAGAPVLGYGTGPEADIRVVDDGGGELRVRGSGREIASLRLAVPGAHNVLNATAAIAVCAALDLDVEAAAHGLERFTGVARRFQHLGTARDVAVVDDYAHHPTELRATLAAARSTMPERVVVVVQPHRYTRTALLGAELGRAAAAADLVIVTDVYAAGEPPVPGVSGRTVADAARGAGASVVYVPHLAEVAEEAVTRVRPGDLVVITGAGDVTHVGPALLALLEGER